MTRKKTPVTPELTSDEQREIRIAALRDELGDAVTLYPLEGVFISDVPHVEQTVDVERAEELLGYFPPAFTTVRPPDATSAAAGDGDGDGDDVTATNDTATNAGEPGSTPQEV